MATDGEQVPNYTQDLVTNGCAIQFPNPTLQKLINPALSLDSKTLSFNQFGFVDDSDSVALNFQLDCVVKIGNAPTCSTDGFERRIIETGMNKVAGHVTVKTQIDSTSGAEKIGNLAVSPKNEQNSAQSAESAAPILASATVAMGLAALL